MKANVSEVYCASTNIKEAGDYAFVNSTGAKKVVIGNWLVKFEENGSILNLATRDLSNVNIVNNYGVKITGNIRTIRVGRNTLLPKKILTDNLFSSGRSVEEVYINGEKLECKNANDTIPEYLRGNSVLMY